jgi:Ala-tRNA(Pro) deacylase
MTIRDFLNDRAVWHQLVMHRPSASSSRRAHSLGVPGRRVAKSVVLASGDQFLMAVLPSTHRVDLGRLAEWLHLGDLRLARPEEIERLFVDCELGAIPPFGSRYGIETVVDASLGGSAEIVAQGNARHEAIRMRYRDFEAIERPLRGRFAVLASPRASRPPRRKAG